MFHALVNDDFGLEPQVKVFELAGFEKPLLVPARYVMVCVRLLVGHLVGEPNSILLTAFNANCDADARPCNLRSNRDRCLGVAN
jgi:hypothetical protein